MIKRAVACVATLASVAFVAAILVGVAPSSAVPSRGSNASTNGQGHFVRVCGSPAQGNAACDALLNTDLSRRNGVQPSRRPTTSTTRASTTTTRASTTTTTLATTTTTASTTTTTLATTTTTIGNPPPPSGYGPADLQSAYGLAPYAVNGAGQTVAIVDAYNDPSAASDLATYRTQFNLPACGTGCFTKVNQNGLQGSYPSSSGSWSQEISLDLDMVSAICPHCNILLVEANSASFSDLGTAENEAAALGATEISNSWGGQSILGTDLPDSSYGSYFKHPGIAITAASGDGSYTGYPEYPASSDYVTSVGGTTLNPNSSYPRGWSETAWSGAGSGCSGYNNQPSWQTSEDTGCSLRAVADVSAVADPNTGVAVYDSYAYLGSQGWLVFGGTSVASPIIASVYAIAGNAATATSTANNNPGYGSYPYSHTVYWSNNVPGTLNDVTSGSNGSCSPAQLCTGRGGWDGPTGLGTPWGIGAF